MRLPIGNFASPLPYLEEEAQSTAAGAVVDHMNEPRVRGVDLYAQLLPCLSKERRHEGLAAFKVTSGHVETTVLKSGVVPTT